MKFSVAQSIWLLYFELSEEHKLRPYYIIGFDVTYNSEPFEPVMWVEAVPDDPKLEGTERSLYCDLGDSICNFT